MKLVTLTTATDKGVIVQTAGSGVFIDGKPIALMGAIATHPTGPDTLIMGSPGITVNGIPVAFSTGVTAKGCMVKELPNILISGGTPIVGCVKAARLQNEGKGVEKQKEVTFTSDYPLQQLFIVAKKDSEVVFIHLMMDIFGSDIPYSAYQQFFHDACDKKIKMPPIVVVKNKIVGYGNLAFNSNDQKIYINEKFIRKSVEATDEQLFKLLIALVEEFGHYIDWLLRNKYSSLKNTDAQGDEGASYSYQIFHIDVLAKDHVYFADCVIDGQAFQVKYEYTVLHKAVLEAQKERAANEDKLGEWEFFGAGDPNATKPHHFGHGSIERLALAQIFSTQIRSKIYFGNWLRDFSQFIDPMVIRPFSHLTGNIAAQAATDYKVNKGHQGTWGIAIGTVAKNMIKNFTKQKEKMLGTNPPAEIKDVPFAQLPESNGLLSITKALISTQYKTDSFFPTKFSHDSIISILKILAAKEFIAEDYKDEVPNYRTYIKVLEKEFGELTKELVGVYRPEEHIDNPMALKYEAGPNKVKPREHNLNFALNQHMGFGTDEKKGFVKDPIAKQFDTDGGYGMKNYIRTAGGGKGNGNNYPFPTSYEYMMEMFTKATNEKNDKLKYTYLGAGLHVLEDYFAHSNFCEIALSKIGFNKVFPWVEIENVNKLQYGCWSHTPTNLRTAPPVSAAPKKSSHGSWQANTTGMEDRGLGRTPQGNDRLGYYADFYPVVTGSFGLLDTLASVLPKLNEALFYLEPKPYGTVKKGEINEADMFILEILKNMSMAQGSHITAKDKNGTSDDTYAQWYEAYLYIRDVLTDMPDFLFFVKPFIHKIQQYINIVINFFIHHVINIIAVLIDDVQTLELSVQAEQMANNKYSLGTNPTHTQLAKDDFEKPLHELAAKLAIDAVREVGQIIYNIWNNTSTIEDLTNKIDIIFCHPVYSDWADQSVNNWARDFDKDEKGNAILKKGEKQYGNRKKIDEAGSPSIVVDNTIYTLDEIDNALSIMQNINKHTNTILKAFDINLDLTPTINTLQIKNNALRKKFIALQAQCRINQQQPQPIEKKIEQPHAVKANPKPLNIKQPATPKY